MTSIATLIYSFSHEGPREVLIGFGLGKRVEGTSHVACKAHHPHRQGPVTAESIARVAKHGHNTTQPKE